MDQQLVLSFISVSCRMLEKCFNADKLFIFHSHIFHGQLVFSCDDVFDVFLEDETKSDLHVDVDRVVDFLHFRKHFILLFLRSVSSEKTKQHQVEEERIRNGPFIVEPTAFNYLKTETFE